MAGLEVVSDLSAFVLDELALGDGVQILAGLGKLALLSKLSTLLSKLPTLLAKGFMTLRKLRS